MEPCLFRHGKVGEVSFLGTAEILLQWSHVFSDMVSGSARRYRHIVTGASMEPCLFRHGKCRRSSPRRRPKEELQWSHVFSDMVSAWTEEINISELPLQWSHVFSDMVRAELGGGYRARSRRFNGAMSFQTW